MSILSRLLVLLLVSWPVAAARAEVLVRWDLDQVPSREILGIQALVVPASRPAAVREALDHGYRVYLEVDAAALRGLGDAAAAAAGVVVRGRVTPQLLDEVRGRLRVPGARVLSIDERGLWPQVRLSHVTLRDSVLQVASRSAQPWVDSNAVFTRISPPQPDAVPLTLSPPWEPVTEADARLGPAVDDYLVAIAEAGSFGHDLVLPLHESFARRLLEGHPGARGEWADIRRYIEFYSSDLPRRYRRASNIAVVCANPMESIEILRLLTRHNLPFELAAPDALPTRALNDFALVVVVDPVTPPLVQPLTDFAAGGGTVVVNGPDAGIQWEGAVGLVQTDRHRAYRVGRGRVLQLVEPIQNPDEFALGLRDVLGPAGRAVDVWNGLTVLVARYEDEARANTLITVLDYARAAQPLPMRVTGVFKTAHCESPESGLTPLPVEHRNGHTEFVVPAMRVGGRVFLSLEP